MDRRLVQPTAPTFRDLRIKPMPVRGLGSRPNISNPARFEFKAFYWMVS